MSSSDKEFLAREYEQAGSACRNHESLIRTGITIFAAAQAAILAILMKEPNPNPDPFYAYCLELLGLWLSVVVGITTFRLGRRYTTYMKRAKSLEHQLGFALYTASQEEFEKHWYLRKPGNQTWLLSLPILTALIYIIHLGKAIANR